MKYENFSEFLSSLNYESDELNLKCEELRKKKKKTYVSTSIILLIVDAIILFIMFKNNIFSYEIPISLGFFIPILFVNMLILILVQAISGNADKTLLNKDYDVENLNKEYKYKVINKLLENFIEELDYVPLKILPSEIFDEAKEGESYNIYESDDYFEGKIKGQKIVMADLLVQEQTTERNRDGKEETVYTTIFNGLLGKIDLNKSICSNLTIKKDNGFSFKNKQKLEMDFYEFEKVFNVYTDNNIIGMQLLTSDIQEDILELYNKYKINFEISIKYNKLYIFLNTGNMFEVFSINKSPNEVLEKYFDIMKFIYKLVEKLIITVDNTQI